MGMKKFIKIIVLLILTMFVCIGCNKEKVTMGTDELTLDDKTFTVRDVMEIYHLKQEFLARQIKAGLESNNKEEVVENFETAINVSTEANKDLKKCLKDCEKDSAAYETLDYLRKSIEELGGAAKELNARIDNDNIKDIHGDKIKEHFTNAMNHFDTYVECSKEL